MNKKKCLALFELSTYLKNFEIFGLVIFSTYVYNIFVSRSKKIENLKQSTYFIHFSFRFKKKSKNPSHSYIFSSMLITVQPVF